MWNNHRIRAVRGQDAPYGKPDIMYNIPAIYNADDCLIPVHQDAINNQRDQCAFRDICPCDPDVYELSLLLMAQYHWEIPRSVVQCVELYLNLRSEIRERLHV